MENKKLLLKCLVGSRAHGLHTEDSDYDYRGVYVLPTQEILSLSHKYKGSSWIEGNEDNTSYEIGHFLELAIKCNPSILEVFIAPPVEMYANWGVRIKMLFDYVWNPKDAFNAFVGYGLNQRKKMLDNNLGRWEKYAVAYLRTLLNLNNLLKTGTFSLEVTDSIWKRMLIKTKNKQYLVGSIIDKAQVLTEEAREYLEDCKHESDKEKVNSFLLEVRKEFWE